MSVELNSVIGMEASEVGPGITKTKRQVRWYSTRAQAVSAASAETWTVGAQIAVGPCVWEYDGTSTAISDMTGWVPVAPVSLEHWGGAPDGVTNSLSAERAAMLYSAGSEFPPAIRYYPGEYLGTNNINDITAPGLIQNGMWGKMQAGTSETPTSDQNPVLIAHKVSDTDATDGDWDGGAIYGSLTRTGGAAFGGFAISGLARFQGGSGDIVGVHGRSIVEFSGDAGGWGLWGYATDTTAGSRHLIGCELNIVKKGPDAGWQSLPTVSNTSRGLVVAVESSAVSPATIGIYIGGRATENSASRWYTGQLIQQDSIVPNPQDASTGIGNGEAIRIQGGSTYSNRYGGIRFEKGQYQYGISFVESTFAGNTAIILGSSQRIKFGTNPGSTVHISWNGVDLVNFTGANIARDGTQVIGQRKTGWAAATGTATRSTFATTTVTTEQLAQRVKALIDDLTSHGLIGA